MIPTLTPRPRTIGRIALATLALAWASGALASADAPDPAALARRASEVLKAHCYRCHGQDGRSEGGLAFVTELRKLVESKRVLPGDPAGSKLLKRVASGEMPPEVDFEDPSADAPPLPRLRDEEVAALRDWIRAGAPSGAVAPARAFVSDADILKAIRDDLKTLGVRERRFARYFTLVHLRNAGYSEDQLQSYRHGLSKLVNSLSWNRRIKAPTPVDPDRVVLRIDLRDYLWDEEIWRAILEANPYAPDVQGPVADAILDLSGGDVPFVRADWFVFAASRPPLYHDVLRLPETVEALERKLDVDVAADIRQDRVVRAAFVASGVSRNNRLIERHESTNGGYWRSYDFAGNADRKNLFSHPLGPGDGPHDFEHDGGETIFALPNGLNGYMLMDGRGARIDKGPTEIVRDNKQGDGAVVNGISCMSCHNRGLIEKGDQVRDLVLRTKAFDRDTTDTILALYPPKDRLAELFAADLERFAKAVKATGSSLSQTEPVYALARQFEEDLNLDLAAAEAGMTVKAFEAAFAKTPELAQALGLLLVGGTVKRDAFVDAYPLLVDARHPAARVASRPGAAAPRATPPTVRGGSGRWFVLFRGRDPKAWNTRSSGPTVAVPLSEAPPNIQYLRLRRMDTNEALIIAANRGELAMANNAPSPRWGAGRWCGTNEVKWGSHHLGIAEGPKISGFDDSGRNRFAVQVEFVDFWAGSGFGHIAHGDESRQHFGWRGREIDPTDFEIAVSAGPPTSAEMAMMDLLARPEASPASPPRAYLAGRPVTPARARKVTDDDRLELLANDRWPNDRDGFRDVAPPGAVLVGVRVRTSGGGFGVTVRGIQPVFLDGRAQVEGDWHGTNPGEPGEAIAKSGYAVGAIRTRTGLTLDGFQLIFMRRKGDRLDPSDSYASPWFGNTTGGSPGGVSGDGRLIVGIQGRSAENVNSLSLIALKPGR